MSLSVFRNQTTLFSQPFIICFAPFTFISTVFLTVVTGYIQIIPDFPLKFMLRLHYKRVFFGEMTAELWILATVILPTRAGDCFAFPSGEGGTSIASDG